MLFLRSLLLSYWLPLATANGPVHASPLPDPPHYFGEASLITATDAHLLTATASGASSANVDAMVDDLNSRYANGRPSDDYGELGFVLRMVDGVCVSPASDPFANEACDFNMANAPPGAFFGGTKDGPNNVVSASYNDMINTPKSSEFGDKIHVFPSWEALYGPAAGLVYFPCATEKSVRCMWPTDGGSDGRPLNCGRANVVFTSFPGCADCISENSILPGEDNTVNGRTIHRLDDIPTEANLSSYEIELLFNRASKKTVHAMFKTSGTKLQYKDLLSKSCDLCESSMEDYAKDKKVGEAILYDNLFMEEYRWYEGPAYYGSLAPEDGTSVTKPRNELKQMLEAQLELFGPNHDYTGIPSVLGTGRFTWNEWALDGNIMSKLEEGRAFQDDAKILDFEGNDADGKCGAAIKALVMICGDQEDPFYYGEPGRCLDFAEVYKEYFGAEDTPPVVYLNQKNFTHPFSTTCDIKVPCGVEKTDAAGPPPDAASTGVNSAGSVSLGSFAIYSSAVVLSVLM